MISLRRIGGVLEGRAGLVAAERRLDASQAGFTLVEMLVVITIIGLIMGLIGPRVLNYLSESKVKAARIRAAELRERARPVLPRRRPVPLHGRRVAGAGPADARRRRLERTVSEGQRRAQ